MIVGYVRVSTIEQNEERQIKALEDAGCEKVFSDKLSGKNTKRPGLQMMLDFVREGDILIVSEYSRLARSTHDLLEIIENLNKKDVQVKSLKENLDTATPQGKLMLTIFAGLAEFERTLMLQRQREGIAIAKAQGKYGRNKKKIPSEFKDEILTKAERLSKKEIQKTINITQSSKKYHVARNTLYSWINEILE